ncbi:hypothetical protein SCG7109_AF_00010 [Chlamydiales bacterium SCGC AG-110-M15]|nr:hypothetical protein SCG7109_AF_00010 [Chlamydiales bacterium SCGC AG-110-M15]
MVDNTITIADVDNTNIVHAQVAISNNHFPLEDQLAFDDLLVPAITGSYDAKTGILTLNGEATLAEYDSVLQTVTYMNLSHQPNLDTRTLSFTVNDGAIDNNVTTISSTSNAISYDIDVIDLNNAPEAYDPRVMRSLDFDADQKQYIDIVAGLGSSLNITDAITMEASIYPTEVAVEGSTDLGGMILNKELSYEVARFADGTIRWAINNERTGWKWVDTGLIAKANEWSHVVVTYEQDVVDANGETQDTVMTYLFHDDGTFETHKSISIRGDIITTEKDFRIGSRTDPTTEGFTGQIREARVWDIARSFEDAERDSTGFVDPSDPNLMGYWRLDEGTGIDIHDLTSNNNDGTLTSTDGNTQATWGELAVTDPYDVTASKHVVITLGASDVEGDPLTIEIVTAPTADTGVVSGRLYNYTDPADVESRIDISGAFDTTGLVELVVGGAATLTDPQSRVLYVPDIADDGTGHFEFISDDGGLQSAAARIDLVVEAAPAATPLFDEDTSGLASLYNIAVDPAITFNDITEPNFVGAEVIVAGNHIVEEDLLEFTPIAGITGSFDAATGTLTFEGEAAKADYDTVLQSITYRNLSEDPTVQTRTMSYQVFLGELIDDEIQIQTESRIIHRNVDVASNDDLPIAYDPRDERAVEFEGDNNEYIEVLAGAGNILNLTSGITMEARINPTNAADPGNNDIDGIILNKELSYEVARFKDGSIRYSINNTNSSWTWVNTGLIAKAGEWSHIAVSYTQDGVLEDGSIRDVVYTYLVHEDGTVESNRSLVVKGDIITSEDSFRIANRTDPISEGFSGRISEVRIWDDGRSEEDILANSDSFVDPTESGLVGYWRLDEGTGTHAHDLTGNGNDGLLTSSDSNLLPEWVDDPVAVNYDVVVEQAIVITLGGVDVEGVNATYNITTTPGGAGILYQYTDPDDVASRLDYLGVFDTTGLTAIGALDLVTDPLHRVLYVPAVADAGSTETIAFTTNDGGLPSVAQTIDIDVAAAPLGVPVITLSDPSAIDYTENDGLVFMDDAITLTDPKSTHIIGARVTLTGPDVENFNGAMTYTPVNGINGEYDRRSGDLMFWGFATVEDYQSLLQSIRYINHSDNPDDTLAHTVTYQVFDTVIAIDPLVAPYTFADIDPLSFGVASRDINIITVNDAPITAGQDGGSALSFDGEDSYVELDPTFTTDFPADFTIETWFSLDSLINDGTQRVSQTIFSKHNVDLTDPLIALGDPEYADENAHMKLEIEFLDVNNPTDAQLVFSMGDASMLGTLAQINQSITLTEGQWYHVAVTYDATTNGGVANLYLDGMKVIPPAATGNADGFIVDPLNLLNNFNNPLVLGQMQDDGHVHRLKGSLDEFRVWDTIRTEDEIHATSAQPISGQEANLMVYYKFDETRGNTAINVADTTYGNLYNGHLLGADALAQPEYEKSTLELLRHAQVHTSDVTLTDTIIIGGVDLEGQQLTTAITLVDLNAGAELQQNDTTKINITGVVGTDTSTFIDNRVLFKPATGEFGNNFGTFLYSLSDGTDVSETETVIVDVLSNPELTNVDLSFNYRPNTHIGFADGVEEVITSDTLSVTDADSDPEDIVYILSTDLPSAADILTLDPALQLDTTFPTRGEIKLDGVLLAFGDSFTQKNINDGLVTYTYTYNDFGAGEEPDADPLTVDDIFTFRVYDGKGAYIISQKLDIHIDPFNGQLRATGIGAGGSLEFDGDDGASATGTFGDYVEIDNTVDKIYNVTDALTLEAWIYPTAVDQVDSKDWGGTIINKENAYQIARFEDGTIRYALRTDNHVWAWIDTGIIAPENEWSHVTLTYDKDNEGVKIYVYNDIGGTQSEDVFTDNVTGAIAETAFDLRIGNRTLTSESFEGRIDEVRVWDRALTEDEVSFVRKNSTVGSEGGLIGFWQFDQIDGTVAPDRSQSGADGVVVNADWVDPDDMDNPTLVDDAIDMRVGSVFKGLLKGFDPSLAGATTFAEGAIVNPNFNIVDASTGEFTFAASGAGVETFSYIVELGAGQSPEYSVTVTISGVPIISIDDPVIPTNADLDYALRLDGIERVISTPVTVNDLGNFVGQRLTAVLSQEEVGGNRISGSQFDRLAISDFNGLTVSTVDNDADGIVDSYTIRFGGDIIATATGGETGTSPLRFSFTNDITEAGVEAIIDAVTYQNTSNTAASPLDRIVTFTLRDSAFDVGVAEARINILSSPTLANANARVLLDRGEQNVVVTPEDFEVTDGDSADVDVVYTILSLPGKGSMLVSGLPATVGSTFTQADIVNGNITYNHDILDTLDVPNTFTYSVTDSDGQTLIDEGGNPLSSGTFTFKINSLNYLEGSGAVVVRQDISVDSSGNTIVTNDINSSGLSSATSAKVVISLPLSTQTFNDSPMQYEDALVFVDTAKIQGSYDADTGTLTLSAVAGVTPTLDDFQEAFNNVRFINKSTHPTETFRTVTFTASNGVDPDFVFSQDLEVVRIDSTPIAYSSGAGNALSFDGLNDHAAVHTYTSLPSDSFTIETSFFINSTPNNGRVESLISMTSVEGGADNKAVFSLQLRENGEIQFIMGKKDGSVFELSAGFPKVNQWNNVAVSYNDIGGGVTLYLNGSTIAFGAMDPLQRLTGSNNEPLQIGRYTNNFGDNNFKGVMDEVRIWSTNKSEIEIKATINDKQVAGADDLDAYWRFDEATGIDAYDASGNGHTAYLQGNGPLEETSRIGSSLPMKLYGNGATHNAIVHAATATEGIIIGGIDPEDGEDLTVTITSFSLPQGAKIYQYDGNSLNLGDLRGNVLTASGPSSILTDPGSRFIFQSLPGDTGSNIATVTYTVTDSAGNVSAPETVIIDSIPGNAFPVNDHVNPLNVFEGGIGELGEDRLHVIDIDTPDHLLSYQILDVPDHGVILMDGNALSVGDRFTQQDVNDGLITYEHDGGESIHDTFSFDVTDDAGNRSPVRLYNIAIHPINDVPVGDFHSPTSVSEGAITVFNNVELHAVDYDSSDDQLIYTFTKAPEHGVIMKGSEVIGLDGTFTQEDVNLGLVAYQHDGGESLEDSFEFHVADEAGASTESQIFTVNINAVNDDPVLMTIEDLQIDPGDEPSLLKHKLFAYDPDSPTDEVVYTLETVPSYGMLKKNGYGLGLGATFTQEDINSGNMTYAHDGGDSTEDGFALSISDGQGGNVTHTNFNVHITALIVEEPEVALEDLTGSTEEPLEEIPEEVVEAAETSDTEATNETEVPADTSETVDPITEELMQASFEALNTITQATEMTSDAALEDAVEDIIADEIAEEPEALPAEIEYAVIEAIIEHVVNVIYEEEVEVQQEELEELVIEESLLEEEPSELTSSEFSIEEEESLLTPDEEIPEANAGTTVFPQNSDTGALTSLESESSEAVAPVDPQKVEVVEKVLEHLNKMKEEESSSNGALNPIDDPTEPINLAIQSATDLLKKYEGITSAGSSYDSSESYEAPTSTNFTEQQNSTLHRFFSGEFKSPFERVTDLLKSLMEK